MVLNEVRTSSTNFLISDVIFIFKIYKKFYLRRGGKLSFSVYFVLDMVIPLLIFKTSLPGMNSYYYPYFMDRWRNGNTWRLNYFPTLYN